MRRFLLSLSLTCAALIAPFSLQAPLAQTVTTQSAGTARVIVKYRVDATELRKSIQAATATPAAVALSGRTQALGQRIGIALVPGAMVSARSHVVFAAGLSSEQLAARLGADAEVEYAVPDLMRRRFAVPNDPYYKTRAYTNGNTAGGPLVGQWYLKPPGPATTSPTAATPNTAPAAMNAEQAWDLTTGSASVVVAVLDTGIRFDHSDFKTVANGGNLLPGYDMISGDADGSFTTSADGNGRDADASDPGDFVLQADVGKGGCTAADAGDLSSWHGTETAGLIGAVTDNAVGIASVGRNVRVLPVRVLGRCGGYDSDIVAGMRWAAGIDIGGGVPVNANKARVINMSLGGVGACSQAYVDAVADVRAQGVVVVASAGNSAGHAVSTPANCPGVIGVLALRHIGTKVGFSDLGPAISIAAPGGNCVSLSGPCLYPIMTTSNAGSTTPVAGASGATYSDSFKSSIGTSFSAPLVAGTVALMLSAQPALTPDEVRYKLQSSARAFPTPTVDESGAAVAACAPPDASVQQLQCVCSTGLCGAGMLDAHAAVLSAIGVQARIGVSPATPLAGQTVTFDAVPSILPAGHTITSYRWALADGGGIVTGLVGATDGPSVSATPNAAGTFTVTLTLTDNANIVSAESLSVTVGAVAAVAQSSGGGGGGAPGFGWLLLLAAAIVALRLESRANRMRGPAA